MGSLPPASPVILLLVLALMLVVLRSRPTLGRRWSLALGSAAVVVASSTIPTLFAEYELSLVHALCHLVFTTILATYARLLTVDEAIVSILQPIHARVEVGVFDRLQYAGARAVTSGFEALYARVEVGVFDRLQYVLSGSVQALAAVIRNLHTGSLNAHLLSLLVFLVITFIIFVFLL